MALVAGFLKRGLALCRRIVPAIEHRTCADEEAEVLCFEPKGVLNTGNVIDDLFTAPKGVLHVGQSVSPSK